MGAAPSRVDLTATMPKGELDCLRSQCELHTEEDPSRKKKSSDERRNDRKNMQHNNECFRISAAAAVQSACMWLSCVTKLDQVGQDRDRLFLEFFFVFVASRPFFSFFFGYF